MSFTEIKPFLTDEEKQRFLARIDEDEWHQHKSTVSGKLSPLQFKRDKLRGIDVLLMKMDPNAVQDWHTDGVTLKRNTLILHPITDNYAPFQSEQGESTQPIIADTQARHAVFNNESTRLNLQIPFDVDYNDAIKEDSPVWDVLNKLYKDDNE